MLTLCAGLANVAWGAPFLTQHYRVGYRSDFDDIGAAVDDDFLKGNVARPARFNWVVLYRWDGFFIGSGFTDEDGLISFANVDSAQDHYITLVAHSDVEESGRDLFVRDDVGGDIFTADSAVFDVPAVTDTKDVVFDAAVSGQEWINPLIAGTWTIARRPDGWPTFAENGAEYNIVFLPPPGSATLAGLYDPADAVSYVNPNVRAGFASKYIIAHELAHQLQHWVNIVSPLPMDVGWAAAPDYGATDDCLPLLTGTHFMVSKEYQSAAILEGMADWVAAVAFNHTSDTDCRLKPQGNFPWIGGLGPTDDQFSCQGWDDVGSAGDNGGVEWTGYSIDAFDYLGDYCNTGTMTDRGTELDWLRFFWDLDRSSSGGEDMSFEILVELYADAHSFDWDVNPARDELFDAFDAAGFDAEWIAQDHNGIDR